MRLPQILQLLIVALLGIVIAQLYFMQTKRNTLPGLSVVSGRLTAIETQLASIQKTVATANIKQANAQAVSAPTQQKEGVDDVFQNAQAGGALNDLKGKFEGLFVNYQYLRGCNAAEEESYHLLNSALVHELASKGAPARLQYDILTAAQGTYEEIYARSECDAASVGSIKKSFDGYIEKVKSIGFVIQN